MATPDQIAELRQLGDEPDTDQYSDAALGAIIDGNESMSAAAADLWRRKAAASSGLVNVSESGSSRSLGDLSRQALAMATHFAGLSDTQTQDATGIRVRRISRP